MENQDIIKLDKGNYFKRIKGKWYLFDKRNIALHGPYDTIIRSKGFFQKFIFSLKIQNMDFLTEKIN